MGTFPYYIDQSIFQFFNIKNKIIVAFLAFIVEKSYNLVKQIFIVKINYIGQFIKKRCKKY
jgi:hypothetical protein